MDTESFNINLNQNIWALIVSLLTLGISEYYDLYTLYYFGLILSIICSISIIITLYFYTLNYSNKKLK